MEISISSSEMAAVFDEWLRRYQGDPSEFLALADASAGTYGEQCVEYFAKLWDDLRQASTNA